MKTATVASSTVHLLLLQKAGTTAFSHPVAGAPQFENAKPVPPALRRLQLFRGGLLRPTSSYAPVPSTSTYPYTQSSFKTPAEAVVPAVNRLNVVAQTATNQVANAASYSAAAVGHRARFTNNVLYNGAAKANDLLDTYEALKAENPSNEMVGMMESINTAFRGDPPQPGARQEAASPQGVDSLGGFSRFKANHSDTDEIRDSLVRTVPPENQIVLDAKKVEKLQVLNSLVGNVFNAGLKFMGGDLRRTAAQPHHTEAHMEGMGVGTATETQQLYPRAHNVIEKADRLATASGQSFAAKNYENPNGQYDPVVLPNNFPVVREAAQSVKETRLYDNAAATVQTATDGHGFVANRIFTPSRDKQIEEAKASDPPGSAFMSATLVADSMRAHAKRAEFEETLDKYNYAPKLKSEIHSLPESWKNGARSKQTQRRLQALPFGGEEDPCKLYDSMVMGLPLTVNIVRDMDSCETICVQSEVCDFFSYVPRRSRCYQYDEIGAVGIRDTIGVTSGVSNCDILSPEPDSTHSASSASPRSTDMVLEGASADNPSVLYSSTTNNENTAKAAPTVSTKIRFVGTNSGMAQQTEVEGFNENSILESTPPWQSQSALSLQEREKLAKAQYEAVMSGQLDPLIQSGAGILDTGVGIFQAMTDPKYAAVPVAAPFMRDNPPMGTDLVQALQPEIQAVPDADGGMSGQAAGPGFASTAAMMMQSGTKFMQLVPVAEMAAAGYQLYKTGFLRNRGMNPLRGPTIGKGNKQSMPPPNNLPMPVVRCLAGGMTCCAPKDTGKHSKAPILLNGHNREQCRATFTHAENALCVTVGYNSPDTCGMQVVANGGDRIYQNRLEVKARGVNDIICKCRLSQEADDGRGQYQGQAVWEYQKEAVKQSESEYEESKANAQRFARSAASALAFTQMLGQRNVPGTERNGLTQIRPNADSPPYNVVGFENPAVLST